MRKDEQQRQQPKGKYRVKNWPVYNAGLISRGDVTVWMGQDLWQAGAETHALKRGRPCIYADAVIQMLLGLKQVFRLPLRALQGFAGSMNKLAFTDLPVPNYTMLCRRARDLYVVLPTLRSGEPLHLVIDSIGLKVFGEGEWKVRKHGYSKRRSWRKMHLAMDANTGQICAALMTHQDVGDGAYDTHQCHAAIAARGATPSIPPRDGAASWPKQPAGLEEGLRISPALAGQDTDVPLEGAHGQELGSAHDWRTGHRGSHPRGHAQSHDLAGAPSVRPDRVNSWEKGKVPVRLDLCNNAYQRTQFSAHRSFLVQAHAVRFNRSQGIFGHCGRG